MRRGRRPSCVRRRRRPASADARSRPYATATSGSLLLNLPRALRTMAIAHGSSIARTWPGVSAAHSPALILAGAHGPVVAGRPRLSLDSAALLIAAACLAVGHRRRSDARAVSADPVLICDDQRPELGAGVSRWRCARGRGVRGNCWRGGCRGFLGVGVSLAMFVLALRHLGAARTGAYFSLAPFIGALISIALPLAEPLTVDSVARLPVGGGPVARTLPNATITNTALRDRSTGRASCRRASPPSTR